MVNRRATITRADARRWLQATREAGFEEARMEIIKPDGTLIRIVAGKANETADPSDDIEGMIARVPRAVP